MPPRTYNFIDDQAPRALKWNTGQRWTGHDLMHALMRMLFNDGEPTTGGYVLSGLTCSPPGGSATTDVAAGVAVHYDDSIYTAEMDGEETVCPLGLALLTEEGSVTHDDNVSGSTRYDIVTIKSTLGVDNEQSVQQKGGATSNQDTRWGQLTTLQVTKGTPGASSPPATPSGETLLCSIEIDDGTTGTNWVAGTTYTDARVPTETGPGLRSLAMTFINRSTPVVGQQALIGLKDGNDADHFAAMWDLAEAWPAFFRDTTGGEQNGLFYPMGIPGSRTWKRTEPGSRAVINSPQTNVTVKPEGMNDLTDVYFGCAVANGGGGDEQHYFSIDHMVDDRILFVDGAEVLYDVLIADATDELGVQVFQFKQSSGVTIERTAGEQTLDITGTGSSTMINIPITGFASDQGDVVSFRFRVKGYLGGNGTVAMQSTTITLTEGKKA